MNRIKNLSKKEKIIASAVAIIAVVALFIFSQAKSFGDIKVSYEGQNFELKVPFSSEGFTDESGETIIWRIVASGEDIQATSSLDENDASLGIAKGTVLHAGTINFELERSNPKDGSYQAFEIEITSDGQKITDFKMNEKE